MEDTLEKAVVTEDEGALDAASEKPFVFPARPKETLFSWLLSLGKTGAKTLPQMAKTLGIQIAVVFAVNLVLWWQGISEHIPSIILQPLVFLTAARNGILAKTIYWVIIFSFGKKLAVRIKRSGFKKAMRPIIWLGPELKKAFTALAKNAWALLLMGFGSGLFIANYFASYGVTGEAINKIDKYFVSLLVSFTISYLLGEGRRHWVFKFCRLVSSDVSGLMKKESRYTDNHTYMLMSGFVMGLIADAPLILINAEIGGIKYLGGTFVNNTYISYLGYTIGAVLLLAGVAYSIVLASQRKDA